MQLNLKLLAAICALGLFSLTVSAQEARVYSTEGYCILAFEQVDSEYLNEYEKRLGFKPKNRLCNRINRLITEFQPANWNYQFGQPYPGSSIYISPEQVAKIEQARANKRKARR
jgi:hypothetical protein